MFLLQARLRCLDLLVWSVVVDEPNFTFKFSQQPLHFAAAVVFLRTKYRMNR